MVEFDIIEFEDEDSIEVGKKAPNFKRPLVNKEYWEDKSLSEIINNKPTILIFYSMNGSAPAINLWNKIRERSWDINIIGISISTPYDHKKFIGDLELEYELFSDPSNEVAEKYGVVHDLDGMEGIEEPKPAVFILNQNREIKYKWVATKWPDSPDLDKIQEKVKSVIEQ